MAYTIIYEKAGREIGREVIHVSLAAAQAFANDMVATGEYDRVQVRDEADMTQTPDLKDALARLKSFRAAWNAGDVIDEGSGLTAKDIDVVTGFVTDLSSRDCAAAPIGVAQRATSSIPTPSI
jgi:hypothetical protein